MSDGDVYCFTHVMKTGGSSLVMYMHQVLTVDLVYPRPGDGLKAYFSLEELRGIDPGRRANIRGYRGHFPAFAADIVGATKTFTLLRHPVDRVVSHVTQQQRQHRPDATLEAVYDDPFYFPVFFDNHQTKVFALGEEDEAGSFMSTIPFDAGRLEAAKERLASYDVVGLQEDHPAAVRAIQAAFGWEPPKKEWWAMVGGAVDVPQRLRDRIAEDNAWDMELYDWAVRTVAVGAPPAASAR